jgi:hypothetical protein
MDGIWHLVTVEQFVTNDTDNVRKVKPEDVRQAYGRDLLDFLGTPVAHQYKVWQLLNTYTEFIKPIVEVSLHPGKRIGNRETVTREELKQVISKLFHDFGYWEWQGDLWSWAGKGVSTLDFHAWPTPLSPAQHRLYHILVRRKNLYGLHTGSGPKSCEIHWRTSPWWFAYWVEVLRDDTIEKPEPGHFASLKVTKQHALKQLRACLKENPTNDIAEFLIDHLEISPESFFQVTRCPSYKGIPLYGRGENWVDPYEPVSNFEKTHNRPHPLSASEGDDWS